MYKSMKCICIYLFFRIKVYTFTDRVNNFMIKRDEGFERTPNSNKTRMECICTEHIYVEVRIGVGLAFPNQIQT